MCGEAHLQSQTVYVLPGGGDEGQGGHPGGHWNQRARKVLTDMGTPAPRPGLPLNSRSTSEPQKKAKQAWLLGY